MATSRKFEDVIRILEELGGETSFDVYTSLFQPLEPLGEPCHNLGDEWLGLANGFS